MSKGADFEVRLGLQARGIGEDWPLILGAAKGELGELELQENCTFCLKPTVSSKGRRLTWGDMMVVKPQGGVRMGTRPQGPIVTPS
jgi:hypothetical protein